MDGKTDLILLKQVKLVFSSETLLANIRQIQKKLKFQNNCKSHTFYCSYHNKLIQSVHSPSHGSTPMAYPFELSAWIVEEREEMFAVMGALAEVTAVENADSDARALAKAEARIKSRKNEKAWAAFGVEWDRQLKEEKEAAAYSYRWMAASRADEERREAEERAKWAPFKYASEEDGEDGEDE